MVIFRKDLSLSLKRMTKLKGVQKGVQFIVYTLGGDIT